MNLTLIMILAALPLMGIPVLIEVDRIRHKKRVERYYKEYKENSKR